MPYVNYDFKSHFASINDFNMHYIDEGQGEPLVMLHGNPTWSFYYRHLITGLKTDYRCIAPDHIGMGLSDKPSDKSYSFTLSQRINDLEVLLDTLNIKNNINLILHDWGGIIGMAYATRYPQRIKRITLHNTAAFHLPKGHSLPWQLKLSRLPYLGKALIQGLNLFAIGATQFCTHTQSLDKNIRHAYLAPYHNWHSRLALWHFVMDIPIKKQDSAYHLVTEIENNLYKLKSCPMLIAWGMHDFVFNSTFLKQWQYYFPQAEYHLFPNSGHYLLEDSHDDILLLVKNFLQKHH